MRTLSSFLTCTLAILVSGCASPRQTYVNQHPDLPADHRRILLSGTIQYGDPVVGMTKEEIRLAMGKVPTKTELVDGEEAWIWTRVKEQAGRADPWDATNIDSVDAGSNQAARSSGGKKGATAAPDRKQIKTTIFFHGDLANRVQIDEESL